jgi:hypothetical protein
MIDDLNEEQNARVAAIKVARDVLSEHSGGPLNSTVKTADTIDLVNIASWIIDGKDPWKPVRPEIDEIILTPVSSKYVKEDPAYPYGRCDYCGFGMTKDQKCYNPGCTAFYVLKEKASHDKTNSPGDSE